MIDLSVFHLNPETELPASQITTELNSLRQGINRHFYISLNPQQRDFFHYFMWNVLHGFWQTHSSSSVRIAASSTLGTILMKLAPFYYKDFMNSLREAVMNTTNDSFLLLACFCFLAKFHSMSSLKTIFDETPILHLFGMNNSEHIPDLVAEICNEQSIFPSEFLTTVVELFINLSIKNPSNRHFPKAASIIIARDIQKYADLITADIPLITLDSLFPQIFPLFANETVQAIREKSLNEIKSNSPQLAMYESACRVLHKLILSQQVQTDDIAEAITEEMIKKSPSMASLLLLPVNPDFIKKLYQTSESDEVVDSLELNKSSAFSSVDSFSPLKSVKYKNVMVLQVDKAVVVPLLNYFAHNISCFEDEIVSLISQNLDPASENYAPALSTLGAVSDDLNPNDLNELLTKALLISTNNWIHLYWTIRMLGKINFKLLTKPVSDKAFDTLDLAVVSKSTKLQQTVKKVSLKIFNHCKIEIFKLFIDKFCRKFDIFDQVVFEYRISYLSFLFTHTPSSWTISFIHIANLLTEAVSLINFSNNVLMEIFSLIGVLAQNFRDSLVLFFANQAIEIIESSYFEFTGEQIGIGRPSIFESYNHSKLVENLGSKHSYLSLVDTDLTANPGLCHNTALKLGESAFEMISKVKWATFSLNSDDAYYFLSLGLRMLNLFPCHSNSLISSLIDINFVSFISIENFLKNSLLISNNNQVSLISLCKLISLIIEHYDKCDFSKYDFSELKETLILQIPLMKNIDFLVVLSIQRCNQVLDIHLDDDVYESIIVPSQIHLLNPNDEKEKSMPSLNPNDDDLIDTALLYGNGSSDMSINDIVSFNLPNESDNELKPSEFNVEEVSPLVEDSVLLRYVSSLTPFYFLNLEVPNDLLKVPLIFGFSNYGTFKISEDQCLKLIETVLSHGTVRCLYFVLKYMLRMKIYLEYDLIKSKLSHAFFLNKSVTLVLLPLLRLKTLPNDYITSIIGMDYIDFVLNASNNINRRVSIAVMRIDPAYFMKFLLQISKFKYDQILNLVFYASTVMFPPNDFFSFASKIISDNINSRKKRYISRRLFTVFVATNRKNSEIISNANNLLTCEVIPLSSSNEIKKLTPGQIVEFYFEIATIAKNTHCKPVIETMYSIFSKNTPYGAVLSLLLHPQTNENIQQMLSSPLSSISTLPYLFFAEKLNRKVPENQQSTNDVTLNSDLTVITQQMIENLLQKKLIRTALSTNIVLVFLINFLNSSYMQRIFLKPAFSFMHSNMTITPKFSFISSVMQIYKRFLNFVTPQTPEFQTMLTFADQLFDHPIIPPGGIEILQRVSARKKDLDHTTMILTPYMKINDSYSMYSICEGAALFALQSMVLQRRSSIDIQDPNLIDTVSDQNTGTQLQIDDAIEVVPIAKSFFSTFCGIIAVEKTKKCKKHDLMKDLFSDSHKIALSLIEDQDMKIFSIPFALLDDDTDVPHDLLEYVEDIRKIVLSKK